MKKTFPWLLFHPNIPKPLHGMAPRVFLGDQWWKATKQKAKEQLDQRCWACGVHKSKAKYHRWLEAHECYSINYLSGKVEYVGTAALCHACHNYIHDGRMIHLLRSGDLEVDKYTEVLDHGNFILKSWFQANGWEWHRFKRDMQPFQPHFKIYPNLPKFTDKIEWRGEPLAAWTDYHMIINGKVYRSKFKSIEDWQRKYK